MTRPTPRSLVAVQVLAAVFTVLAMAAVSAADRDPGGPALLTDYAAHRDGEDWAPALTKALAEARTVQVPAGRYPCSMVRLPTGATLQGAGDTTVFVPLGTQLFVLDGKKGPELKVAADLADFSNTIALEQDGGLAPGDEIQIRGQRNSMVREGRAGLNYSTEWVLGRTRRSSCFYGEFDVVEAVTGTVLTTRQHRLFPAYYRDDSREPAGLGSGFVHREATTVSRLALIKNTTLRRLAIEGTARCTMPLRLSYCRDCLVEDVTFSTSVESYDAEGIANLSVVYGTNAWNTVVRRFKVRLAPSLLDILQAKDKVYTNFSNYNLFKMVSCTNSGFEDCEANGGTHAFSITRNASTAGGGGVPSVNCFVRRCRASNCVWAGVKVQQGCYNTEVRGNTVTASGQGIITCGRQTVIVDNNVSTTVPHAADFYYTHLSRGGTFGIGLIEGYAVGSVVQSNRIDGFYSGIAVADGYEGKNCFEEGPLRIESNTVTGCVRGFSLYKNEHGASLGPNDLRIDIAQNRFEHGGDQAVTLGATGHDTHGVYLPAQTAGVTVRANTFANFAHGVWLAPTVDRITVRDNRFERNDCGITMAAATGAPPPRAPRVAQQGNVFEGTTRQSQGLPPE